MCSLFASFNKVVTMKSYEFKFFKPCLSILTLGIGMLSVSEIN